MSKVISWTFDRRRNKYRQAKRFAQGQTANGCQCGTQSHTLAPEAAFSSSNTPSEAALLPQHIA